MGRSLLACFGKSRSTSPLPEGHDQVDHVEVDVPEGPGPVMVELFSSQGCTTSPAAELLISRLGEGDFHLDFPVIILAFHVDYWDYMGWKDPFGSSASTVRQKAYVEALALDTMFTPQAVIQGRAHCTATDEDALLAAIGAATRYAAPAFKATFQRPCTDTLQVTVTGALRSKVEGGGANIMVALYENGLVSSCPSGENKGKVLANDFVVRKLEKLCAVKDMSGKKMVTGTVSFTLWEGFNSTKCGVAVFVQNSAHHIFGSQNFQLPENV